MDNALKEVCDFPCTECLHKGMLCRRWVEQFEARPDYVTALERDNARYQERAEACWKLAWDCMSYICTMRDEKVISKAAFQKLRERADSLGIYEKE